MVKAKPATDGAIDFRRGLHVLITGSGSAPPDPFRGNSNAAVVVDGVVIQFDCGRGVLETLLRKGINPLDVDYLFFTHLHFDHIATFGYFVISSWICGRQEPLAVFGPSGTSAMAEGMIQHGHVHDVRFVESVIQRWPTAEGRRPTVDPPFAVTEVTAGPVLETDAFTITAAELPHARHAGIVNLAYRVDCRHGSVVVSGDGGPSRNMVELARGVDVLVHECATPDADLLRGGKFALRGADTRPPEEAWDDESVGHTTPTWLGRIAREAGVRKLVATHLGAFLSTPAAVEMSSLYYGDAQDDDFWERFLSRIKQEFSGDVVLAEDGLAISV